MFQQQLLKNITADKQVRVLKFLPLVSSPTCHMNKLYFTKSLMIIISFINPPPLLQFLIPTPKYFEEGEKAYSRPIFSAFDTKYCLSLLVRHCRVPNVFTLLLKTIIICTVLLNNVSSAKTAFSMRTDFKFNCQVFNFPTWRQEYSVVIIYMSQLYSFLSQKSVSETLFANDMQTGLCFSCNFPFALSRHLDDI